MMERLFRDFRGLMGLQEINGLSFCHTYLNDKKCRILVGFIAEGIRANLVKQLQEQDFFSVCMDSSTDSAVLEEKSLGI